MVDRIRNIITRFPEDETAIRDLIRKDRGFDALCQEYADTAKELEKLMKQMDPDAATQADGLRQRYVAVEEELLTIIEGYRPL
jgi:uncharacterized protein YdcH (DUF465 family)